MVMVVADAAFVSSRGPGGLNAADDAVAHEQMQRVIHRLQGDRADLVTHAIGHGVGRAVRRRGNGSQDREPLGGDLDAAAAEQAHEVGKHVLRA